MDQGLGLGTGFPLFNRATASLTRFLQLRPPPPGGKKPPPVLVVHGKGGHAVGDLASYDYFTLGGPYSVCYLKRRPYRPDILECLKHCRCWWCTGGRPRGRQPGFLRLLHAGRAVLGANP